MATLEHKVSSFNLFKIDIFVAFVITIRLKAFDINEVKTVSNIREEGGKNWKRNSD